MTAAEFRTKLTEIGEKGRQKLLDDLTSEASQAFEAGTLTYRVFCNGWISDAMERWLLREEKKQEAKILIGTDLKSKKSAAEKNQGQTAPSGSVNSSGGDGFVSEAGKDAFSRNVKNIRIKGQPVNPSESSPQWREEGFLSEQAAIAFKKAKANNQIRILNERRG